MNKLTQALSSGTLEKVVNSSANNDTLPGLVNLETTNLNTVLAADVLDKRGLANNLDELLASVSVLVDLTNVTRGHALLEGDRDGVVDTTEPNGDVGNEGNLSAELAADLTLVNVASQAVRDEVVGEVVDIVLGRRLGTGAGVTGNTKDVRHTAKVLNEGGNAELGSGSIATGVGNLSGIRDVVSLDELGKTIGPRIVEAVVGRKIDDNALVVGALAALVDSLDKRLANTVGESHDPAVDVATLLHVTNIVGAQALVDDFALVIALQLLARKLTGRDMAEIHVGMRVEEADELLACVTTSTNEGYPRRALLGGILLANGRVGVGLGNISSPSVETEGRGGDDGTASQGGVAPGLLSERLGAGLGSTVQARLEVRIAEHSTTIQGEILHQAHDLVTVVNAIPEHHVAIASDAPVGLVKKPAKVLIVLLHGPYKRRVLLLENSEDVVSNVRQPARLGYGQRSKSGLTTILGRKDNGKSVHVAVIVGLEIVLVQVLKVLVNSLLRVGTLTIPDQNRLERIEILELGQAGSREEFAAAADQGASAGISEQLLLKVTWVDDGHTGRAWKGVQELLDLLDLEASAVFDPLLRHEVVEFLIEVDSGDLLASSVKQTTLLGEVDHLQRLESASKLSSGNIGVNVEDLAVVGLSHGGKNGQVAVADGRLDRLLVDTSNLSYQTPLLLVQVLGSEHANGQRLSMHTLLLQLVDEFQILPHEQVASHSERLDVCDTDSLLELGLDTSLLEQTVELRTSAMDNDGVKADGIKESQARAQFVEVVGQDSTANLDDGESLGRDGCEQRQVLLHLSLRSHRRQSLHYHAPCGQICLPGRRRREWPLATEGRSNGNGTGLARQPSNGTTGACPEGNGGGGEHLGKMCI